MILQDHYVLLCEPGSEYIGHVTPPSGHGWAIAQSIYAYLKSHDLLGSVVAAGADGTVVNVGPDGGAIRYLEMLNGKPMHYFICMLHGNELPFRALFYHYDGKTSGPETWSGPIGKDIKKSLQLLPVLEFQAIPCDSFPVLPDDVMKDLSWDQCYLYHICRAIINGHVDDDLAAIEPGPACVSRWNTLWSRICRLYVATHRPSRQLTRLTTIIVRFSAPMWFHIKYHQFAHEGAKNVFKCLQLMKSLNAQEKSIAKKSIQRNAFFAHSDQILLSMCTDEDIAVRRKAVKLIQRVREGVHEEPVDEATGGTADEEDGSGDDTQDEEEADDEQEISDEELVSECEGEETPHYDLDPSIRRVVVPKLKCRAQSYHTMIDWACSLQSEPPFISTLSDQELEGVADAPLVVPLWKCHTQPVERGIRLLSDACLQVSCPEERDGYMRQRLYSRLQMPSFRAKQHYVFDNQDQ